MNNKFQTSFRADSRDLVLFAFLKYLPFYVLLACVLPVVVTFVSHLLNPNNPNAVAGRKYTELVHRCKAENLAKFGATKNRDCKVWANTIVPYYENL